MIENIQDANKSINRLKLIEAEITLIKAQIQDKIEALNNESEQIKNDLKTYYYGLPNESKEETKTLVFYKLQGGRLLERKQEPEYIRDEAKLIEWARKVDREGYIKEKTTFSFDWINLKKNIIISNNEVLLADSTEKVEGVTVKEREPKFEVEVD